jgi:hypothetical protein
MHARRRLSTVFNLAATAEELISIFIVYTPEIVNVIFVLSTAAEGFQIYQSLWRKHLQLAVIPLYRSPTLPRSARRRRYNQQIQHQHLTSVSIDLAQPMDYN